MRRTVSRENIFSRTVAPYSLPLSVSNRINKMVPDCYWLCLIKLEQWKDTVAMKILKVSDERIRLTVCFATSKGFHGIGKVFTPIVVEQNIENIRIWSIYCTTDHYVPSTYSPMGTSERTRAAYISGGVLVLAIKSNVEIVPFRRTLYNPAGFIVKSNNFSWEDECPWFNFPWLVHAVSNRNTYITCIRNKCIPMIRAIPAAFF